MRTTPSERSRHYGLQPKACRPYRAKTKGKVERPYRAASPPDGAAQTQIVSVARIRLNFRKSVRSFKGIFSADISEIGWGERARNDDAGCVNFAGKASEQCLRTGDLRHRPPASL
jgi:hypothetical protein